MTNTDSSDFKAKPVLALLKGDNSRTPLANVKTHTNHDPVLYLDFGVYYKHLLTGQ